LAHEDGPEDTSLDPGETKVDRETEDIEDIENIEYASTQDSDDDLKDKIVAALHDPGIEVMVVDGTVLLEGEVSDDYAR